MVVNQMSDNCWVKYYTREEIALFEERYRCEWVSEGANLRLARTSMNIGLTEMAKEIGIAIQTLKKLEHGRYVRRRKLIVKDYHNVLLKRLAFARIAIRDCGADGAKLNLVVL
jgi:DNA-binding XRE family transcriptional regulator